MTKTTIRIFGAVQGTDSTNSEIAFRRRKTTALLSYLLVSSTKKSREHLASFFWPNLDHKDARNNLRVALSRMSTDLGPSSSTLLLSDRWNVQINPEHDIWVDVKQFEKIISLSKSHEHSHRDSCAHCHELLKEATELYQGPFLDGISLEDCEEYSDWQSLTRERYRLDALAAFTDLSVFSENTTDVIGAEHYARHTLRLEPLAEHTHRQLMRLLSYQNRRNEALEHFSTFQRYLHAELNIEPEHETVALFHQIQNGDIENTPVENSNRRVPQLDDLVANNLYIEATQLIGRELELHQLEQHLQEHRLVTVLGIGGTGKTRLSLELAKRVLHHSQTAAANEKNHPLAFSDGVFFINLESAGTADDIPQTVATAIDFSCQPPTDIKAQVLNYLKNRSMLLIFDNFEHVIEGHEFLVSLLQTAPEIKLIATSRRKLAISAEAVYLISGLDFVQSTQKNTRTDEEPLNGAAQLFINTAQRVRLNFELSANDLPHINTICHIVEGLPLALILAASWLESLTCAEIVEELSTGISHVEAGMHDKPKRHLSVFAAFNYSWQLLSNDQQTTYASLAVFNGGFTRQAANEITGADLQQLSILLNRTLIQHVPNQHRYGFHNLMHQFALGKLEAIGQMDDIRNRHADYYLRTLVVWESELKTKHARTLKAFEADFDNIRTAWEWAVSQENMELLALGTSPLRTFCTLLSRYHVLIQLLEPTLQIIQKNAKRCDTKDNELNVLVSLGTAYISIGGFIAPEAKESFERAFELTASLETSPALFSTLNALEAYYWCVVNFDRCLEIITRWREHLSHTVHGQRPDYLDDAEVTVNLIEGAVRYQLGELKLAQRVLSDGIALYKSDRHVHYIMMFGQDPAVFCRFWLARCYWSLGWPNKAKEVAQQAIMIAQGLDHPFTKMFAHCAALDIATFSRDYSSISMHAEIVHQYSIDNNFLTFIAISELSRGLTLCNFLRDDDTRAQGIALMEKSLDIFNIQMTTKETYACHVAQVYIQEGLYDKALHLIEDTLIFSEQTRSFCAYAELLQLKAQVLIAQSLKTQAESSFNQALDVARKQDAKIPELRASTHYANYLKDEGRCSDATALISTIYSQFDEGFDTADLESAKALLDTLDSERLA